MTSVRGLIVVCRYFPGSSPQQICSNRTPQTNPRSLYIPCPLRPPVSPIGLFPRILPAELRSRVLTHAYITYTSHSFEFVNDAPSVETSRVASSSSQSNQQECLLAHSLTIVYRHSFNGLVRPRIEGDEEMTEICILEERNSSSLVMNSSLSSSRVSLQS